MVDIQYIGYGTYHMSIPIYDILRLRCHYMIILRDTRIAKKIVDPSPPD